MGSLGEIMKLCRLCLVKDQVNVPIFEGAGDIRKISQKIGACLPVKVTKDDKLPKKICNGCSHKLDMVYQFWNTTTSSEKQLLEWVNNPSSRPLEERGVVAEHIVLKQEVDNGDSEALDAGEFIDVNETFETIGFAHDDDDEMSNENIDIKTENDSRCDEPPIKKHKTVSLSSAESEEDADDPSDAYNRDDSDEDDNDVSEAQPAFVNVAEADQQPGPSGVGKASGEAPIKEELNINQDPFNLEIKIEDIEESEKSITKCHKTLDLKHKSCDPAKNEEDLKFPFYSCSECSLMFNSESLLKLHADHYHKSDENKGQRQGPRRLRCPYCLQDFVTAEDLKDHVFVHNFGKPKFVCDLCSQTFTKKQVLINHLERLHNNSCLVCDFCGLTSNSESIMNSHLKVHMDAIDLYKCDFCQIQFESAENLKRHIRYHDDGVTTFICRICSKIFSTKESLQLHERDFHENSPYLCDICGKTFVARGSLNKHMNIHSGRKMLMCELCGQQFLKKPALTKHLKGHFNKNPHNECYICKKRYTQSSSLRFHMKNNHGKCFTEECNVYERKVLRSTLKNFRKTHDTVKEK